MPTQLVDDVRACLKSLDRLPSARERALLVATIARTDGTGHDVVDELQAARAACPYGTSSASTPPTRADYNRLLRAVDAVLSPVPDVDDRPRRPHPQPLDDADRPYRRDTDG